MTDPGDHDRRGRDAATDTIGVGRMGRPHGVRGECVVHLEDPESGCLEGAREVWIGGPGRPASPRGVAAARRASGGRWILKLGGVDSREAASALSGLEVRIEASLVALDDGEILVADLPGREVVEGGLVVGRISSTYWNGAHDVLVVETRAGQVDFPVAPGYVVGADDLGRVEVEGFEWFAEASGKGKGGGRP